MPAAQIEEAEKQFRLHQAKRLNEVETKAGKITQMKQGNQEESQLEVELQPLTQDHEKQIAEYRQELAGTTVKMEQIKGSKNGRGSGATHRGTQSRGKTLGIQLAECDICFL